MSYTEVSHEHLESMDNTHILLFHEEQKNTKWDERWNELEKIWNWRRYQH